MRVWEKMNFISQLNEYGQKWGIKIDYSFDVDGLSHVATCIAGSKISKGFNPKLLLFFLHIVFLISSILIV